MLGAILMLGYLAACLAGGIATGRILNSVGGLTDASESLAPLSPCDGTGVAKDGAGPVTFSPFARADSRPTFHEWRSTLRDPSHYARHDDAQRFRSAALTGSFHDRPTTSQVQHDHA